MQSLDGARVYFLNELGLQLIESDIASLECLSKGAVLFALSEVILIEASGVGLEFASGCTLSEQVIVAVLNLLVRLTGCAVEEVGPEGDVATDEPQVVIATDEASIEGNAC